MYYNAIHTDLIKDLYEKSSSELQSQISFPVFLQHVFSGAPLGQYPVARREPVTSARDETRSNVYARINGEWRKLGIIDWRIDVPAGGNIGIAQAVTKHLEVRELERLFSID